MDNQHCRFCGHELKHTFADLGLSPLANEYLREADLGRGQIFYPLKVHVCEHCFLTQAALYQQPENIFGEYQYFSSSMAREMIRYRQPLERYLPGPVVPLVEALMKEKEGVCHGERH